MNTGRISMLWLGFAGTIVAFGVYLLPASAARAEEKPAPPKMSKEILAVQVHKQGKPCDKPQSAERDEAQSKPNETVWILKCEGVSYRVHLVPKMAAVVERMENP